MGVILPLLLQLVTVRSRGRLADIRPGLRVRKTLDDSLAAGIFFLNKSYSALHVKFLQIQGEIGRFSIPLSIAAPTVCMGLFTTGACRVYNNFPRSLALTAVCADASGIDHCITVPAVKPTSSMMLERSSAFYDTL